PATPSAKPARSSTRPAMSLRQQQPATAPAATCSPPRHPRQTPRPMTQQVESLQLHRCRNLLAKAPAGMQAEVKDAYWKTFDTTDLTTGSGPKLVEIIDARIREMAARYSATYPAAMKCLTTDAEGLTAYLRFPAEHHNRVRHSASSSAPSARPAAAPRSSAGSPASPAASPGCGRSWPGPRPAGAASPCPAPGSASCKPCAAPCSTPPASSGHAPPRPSPMISPKPSELPRNLTHLAEPTPGAAHRIWTPPDPPGRRVIGGGGRRMVGGPPGPPGGEEGGPGWGGEAGGEPAGP